MREYKIPKQERSYGPIKIRFSGTVQVDYPKAEIRIPASATGCHDYTYKIDLDPGKNQWSGSDSHIWSLAKIKIVVALSILKDAPRYVLAEVIRRTSKKDQVLWKDKFDIYDPYKERKIELFAQGAFINPIKSNADHTYAVGYDDDDERSYLWPCGGDHDGEDVRSIGTGKAFQPECDCLSQMRSDPLTKGLAGIRYGLDGVCHQATNRIVCTAGLEVTDARGYKSQGWKNLTYTLYGRLGLKARDYLGLPTWIGICRGCLSKEYPTCTEESALLVSTDEYEGLTQLHVDDTAEMVEKTRENILAIYHNLAAGKLNPSEYSDKINLAINGYKADMINVLGEPLHGDVFGEIAQLEVVACDKSIAERVFSQGVT